MPQRRREPTRGKKTAESKGKGRFTPGQSKPHAKAQKQAVETPCPNSGRSGDCGLCGGRGGRHKKIRTIY